MLTLSILLVLAVGWWGGGRLAHFERAELHLFALPVLALLTQRALALVPIAIYRNWAWLPLLASYGFIFIFLWVNRTKKKTAVLMGLGSLCNLTVIAANSWRMPVSHQALAALSSEGAAALLAGSIPMYCAAGNGTRLLFLGDIIYFPLPLFRGFASVGDLLLAFGLFFCLMAVMDPVKLPRWLRTG